MSKEHASKKTVVVFFGMTASGKSYLAGEWARRRGYPYFNTDVVRKELVARIFPTIQLQEQGVDKGLYSPEFSRKTYDALLDCAEKALADGAFRYVVLDGSYQLKSERKRVVEKFSGQFGVYFILCHCSEAVTRERLKKRLLNDSAVSDGNLEVYLKQKRKFDKPVEISSEQLLELDTNASLEYLIFRLEHFLSTVDL